MIKPNTLTLIRIAATPPFLLFYWLDATWSLFVCLLIYIVFELTDFLDGNIARRSNMVSDFGKLMDPFADSISRFTVFLCFLSSHLAPVWIIAIFFYRDVFVSVVRVFSIKEGVVVAARQSGKTKAWVQGLVIFTVLIILILQKMQIIEKPFVEIWNIPLVTILISLAAIVTLWSGIDYWLGNKSIVINSMNFDNK